MSARALSARFESAAFAATPSANDGSHQLVPVSKPPTDARRSHNGLYSHLPRGFNASGRGKSSGSPAYAPQTATISAQADVPLRSGPRTMIGRITAKVSMLRVNTSDQDRSMPAPRHMETGGSRPMAAGR